MTKLFVNDIVMKTFLSFLLISVVCFINANCFAQCPVPIVGNFIYKLAPVSYCSSNIHDSITGFGAGGGNGNYSYKWIKSLNDTDYTEIAGATGISYQPWPVYDRTWYKRIVNAGCTDTSSAIIMEINYADFPVDIILSMPTSICPGEAVSFTCQPINGRAAPRFAWAVNDSAYYSYSTSTPTSFTSSSLQQGDTVFCGMYVDRCFTGLFVYRYVVIDYGTCSSCNGYNTWQGTISNSWEDPANWSCHVLPDSTTHVIITNGTVVVNSNPTIYALTLGANVTFTVSPGNNFTILH